MYEEYDDESDGGFSLGRKIALGVGVLAVVVLGWLVVTTLTGKDGGQVKQGAATTEAAATTTGEGGKGLAPSGADETSTPSTAVGETTSAPTTTAAPSTEASTTAAPTTAPTTTAAPTAPTNPDGSPAWVVAIYDENSITITGEVPDQASKDKLQSLAVANAKPGQAATVDNELTINPAVPMGVGVRIVELTSARFDDGSAVIQPPHAAELDRVVNVMNLLPNVTALVIGHADQRGNEVSNYVLSKNRADAVVQYMVSQGIDPARLGARAVGESDLLSLNNDAASLALNKRTEFVLYGLLL
jgi:outer membrane protein OmpA-like peptidoglycan-associated protein